MEDIINFRGYAVTVNLYFLDDKETDKLTDKEPVVREKIDFVENHKNEILKLIIDETDKKYPKSRLHVCALILPAKI